MATYWTVLGYITYIPWTFCSSECEVIKCIQLKQCSSKFSKHVFLLQRSQLFYTKISDFTECKTCQRGKVTFLKHRFFYLWQRVCGMRAAPCDSLFVEYGHLCSPFDSVSTLSSKTIERMSISLLSGILGWFLQAIEIAFLLILIHSFTGKMFEF